MITRRSFLGLLGLGATATAAGVLVPELLEVPKGRSMISVPRGAPVQTKSAWDVPPGDIVEDIKTAWARINEGRDDHLDAMMYARRVRRTAFISEVSVERGLYGRPRVSLTCEVLPSRLEDHDGLADTTIITERPESLMVNSGTVADMRRFHDWRIEFGGSLDALKRHVETAASCVLPVVLDVNVTVVERAALACEWRQG